MIDIGISGTEYDDVPVQELVQAAETLGVKYLELWYPHNVNDQNIDEVRQVLAQNNLQAICVSTWTQLNLPGNIDSTRETIMKGIDTAEELSAPFSNTYFGANPDRSDDEAIEIFARNIRPCLDHARGKGITVVMENEFHASGKDPTRRARNVKQLVETVNDDTFGLTFDACNFFIAGEEGFPYAYDLLKDHIKYIHIKDATKYNPVVHGPEKNHKLWEDESGRYICVPQGEGALNSDSLIRRILRDDYDGVIMLEPHTPRSRVLDAFQKAIAYIENIYGEEHA